MNEQPTLILEPKPKATLPLGRASGRPLAGYRNAAGKRVPGCSTIVGRFKDSGGLIHWAWQMGMEGKSLESVRQEALDAGSCAHEQIHAHLHGTKFNPQEWPAGALNKAEHAMLAFLEWREQSKLVMHASEIPLVSEKHQFGGTFDTVFSNVNSLRLLDYKTSTGLYADYLIQVAGGYSLLWQEHYPDEPLAGMDLLRISKPQAEDDPVSFEHRHFSAEIFPLCQKQFLLLREAYDLDKRLKGLL